MTTKILTPRRQQLTLVGVLALFALEPTLGFLTSNINNILVAFDVEPGQATWVITAGSLAMIPMAILGGAIAGRRASFKALAFFAVGTYTVAGLLPLVIGENFGLLIASRVLWGFGAGLNFTLANSLVAVSYPNEQQRAKVFGLGNVIFSVSAVLSTIVGGQLATISWVAPFSGYLVGILAFALVAVFLQEPPKPAETAANPAAAANVKAFPALAYAPLALFGISIIAMYPMMSLNSVFFAEAALGEPELIGWIGAIPTSVGFFVSLVFGTLYKWFGRWVLPIAVCAAALGLLLAYFATPAGGGSLLLYSLGYGVIGIGLMGLTIGVPMVLTTIVPPKSAALTQGIFAAVLNAGAVLSSFYITWGTSTFGGADGRVSPILLVSAIVVAILIVPAVFIARTKRSAAAEMAEPDAVAAEA